MHKSRGSNKKKKYRFSVGVYQWIQLGMCLPMWSWKGECSIDDPECGACVS